MTNKDLSQFASNNWQNYLSSITELSKSDSGISLVNNATVIYNFDEICKSLFGNTNVPTSADGIQITDKTIQFIEFKSGFKQKISKKNFNEEQAKCPDPDIDRVCKDYWDLFWENQGRKIQELISSLKFKAIESYVILEKHIINNCESLQPGHYSKMIFTAVVDEDGVDGIEDTLAELSSTEPNTDNTITSIRQALKRLSNRKDSDGNTYFYDEIEVLTVKDYENRLKNTVVQSRNT